MKKSELIRKVADRIDFSQEHATEMVNAILDQIMLAVSRGESVTLPGFGSFVPRQRSARTGRDPRSGATLEIAARTTVLFRPGKNLKERVAETE